MDFIPFSEWHWITRAASGVVLFVAGYHAYGWLHQVGQAKNQIDQVKNDTSKELREMSQRIDNIQTTLTQRIDDVTKRIEDVNKRIDDVKDTLGEIQKALGEALRRPAPLLSGETFKRKSPYTLSDLGKKVCAMIGADEWAARLAELVQDEVAGKRPIEIQQFCVNYVLTRLECSKEEEWKIGDAMFEHTGGSRREVLGVLAIVLRDILLERNGYPVPK